ncbi:hypothetical protein PPBDW_p0062 (plasmid) [Photobacterium kishitanii]|nr:hypothetical protein PPBDW_p0062 [Photobacterium kishitanii]
MKYICDLSLIMVNIAKKLIHLNRFENLYLHFIVIHVDINISTSI